MGFTRKSGWKNSTANSISEMLVVWSRKAQGHDFTHRCPNCYANYDRQTVVQNMKQHNTKSPLLFGEIMDGDVIHNRNK